MIWFEERVNSALNKTRPWEVVTTMGREGKEVPAVVGEIRGLELAPNFKFKLGVESESTGANPPPSRCCAPRMLVQFQHPMYWKGGGPETEAVSRR